METIHSAYRMLLFGSAAILALFACVCLFRAILGPRFTDRIVAINVICTNVVMIISVLACLNRDMNYLDIAIVYAMISFLTVVVLSKCYILPRHVNLADPEYKPEPDERSALQLEDTEK